MMPETFQVVTAPGSDKGKDGYDRDPAEDE